MSMFLVFVLGLIALALAMVLPPLLRRRGPPQPGAGATPAARHANVQVLREQLAALDADHAAGVVDDAQYRLARTEIERRALDEEEHDDGHRPVVARRATGTAVVLAVVIPVFAVLMYAALGRPKALDPALAAAPQGEVTLPQIEAMVDGLARRLESQTEPQEGDLQAWTMLANSYAVLNRFPEASKAFARARALSPDNAQLLADHADVLAMMQGQSVEGEPGRLVIAQVVGIGRARSEFEHPWRFRPETTLLGFLAQDVADQQQPVEQFLRQEVGPVCDDILDLPRQ